MGVGRTGGVFGTIPISDVRDLGNVGQRGASLPGPGSVLTWSAPEIGPSSSVLPVSVSLPAPFHRPNWFQQQSISGQADFLRNAAAIDATRTRKMSKLISEYRTRPGVPRRVDEINSAGEPVEGGTVAVAQTDISALRDDNFWGMSANATAEDDGGIDVASCGRLLVAVNPTASNHAEHVALERLAIAINTVLRRPNLWSKEPVEYDPLLVSRAVYLLVEQEPCSSCAAGVGGGAPGVLQQFANLFKPLTLEVRNLRTSRSYIYFQGQLLNP